MTETLHHWIDGARVAGADGRMGDVYNPAIGEVTKHVPLAGTADAEYGDLEIRQNTSIPDTDGYGPVGQASTIKITNNYLSIVAAVTTAEALRFAEAGGVTPEAVFAVVNTTTAMNGHTKMNFAKKVLAGDIAVADAARAVREISGG